MIVYDTCPQTCKQFLSYRLITVNTHLCVAQDRSARVARFGRRGFLARRRRRGRRRRNRRRGPDRRRLGAVRVADGPDGAYARRLRRVRDDGVQSQNQSQSQSQSQVLSKRRLRTMLRGAVVAAAAAVFAHAPLNPGSDENDENVDPNGDAIGGDGRNQSQSQYQHQNPNVATLTCAGGGRVVAPRLTSHPVQRRPRFERRRRSNRTRTRWWTICSPRHTDWVGAVAATRGVRLGCAFLRAWFGLDRSAVKVLGTSVSSLV